MKKHKLTLSRETIRQLTADQLHDAAGGYAPEPSLACTNNCTGNCTNHCPPPVPSQACVSVTYGCDSFTPDCWEPL